MRKKEVGVNFYRKQNLVVEKTKPLFKAIKNHSLSNFDNILLYLHKNSSSFIEKSIKQFLTQMQHKNLKTKFEVGAQNLQKSLNFSHSQKF